MGSHCPRLCYGDAPSERSCQAEPVTETLEKHFVLKGHRTLMRNFWPEICILIMNLNCLAGLVVWVVCKYEVMNRMNSLGLNVSGAHKMAIQALFENEDRELNTLNNTRLFLILKSLIPWGRPIHIRLVCLPIPHPRYS